METLEKTRDELVAELNRCIGQGKNQVHVQFAGVGSMKPGRLIGWISPIQRINSLPKL